VRAPWHALAVDVVVADVLSPGSLVAGRVEAAVVDDRASFFAPLRLALETGVDATAPVRGVDRAGAVVDGDATRPLTSTALVGRWLVGDERLFAAPRLEAGVVTGLSADGGDDGSVGAGAGVGGDVGVAFGGVDLRLRGTASFGTAAWRRAPFSTLYLVERRRALLGATTAAGAGAAGGLLRVPAPAGPGVDVRVEASLFDVVAPLLRVHAGPAPGENVVEAGVIVDADPLRVAVTALRRGMGAVPDVVAPDLVAFPVVGTLEASWRVWGPFSVGVRWLRLPRFRGDGPLRIDDDVWGLVAADGVLAWP
jgi:hypothetical protein